MADDLKLKVVIEWEVDEKQLKSEAQEAGEIVNDNLKIEKVKLQMDKSALEKELKNLVSEMDKAKAKWDQDLYFYAKLEADSVTNQLNQIDNQIEDIDKKMTWWGDGATGGLLWKLTKFFSGAVIIWAVSKLWKAIVNLWNNAEQAQISFTTMLWDANKAKTLLQDLSNFSRKTPFELQWIRESATQLLAMWVTAEDMIPTLKALWDVSAWLNVPLERLALNYGQVLTQWKLTWKELKDFTTAWVPLLDELAKNLWKTKTEIQDMVSKGQVSAQDMVDAFKSMTEEWWRFANLMEEQSKTLAWRWSNLKDWLASIGETIWLEVIPAISDFVWKLWDWIEDNVDSIKMAGTEIFDSIKTVLEGAIDLTVEVWNKLNWYINTLVWRVEDWADKISGAVAWWMTESDRVTAEWLTGMAWNWSDFFYIVQQWIAGIVWSLRVALNVADSLVKKVWKKSFWEWLYEAWNVKVNTYEKWDNIFQTIWNWWNAQKQDFKDSAEWMKKYLKEETKDIKDTWNTELDKLYKDLEDNYVERIDKMTSWTYTANNVKKNKENWWILGDSLLWGIWSGGWKSSKAWDMIDEFWKELKNTYNEMNDALSEHQKNYDKLTDNIKKVESEYDKLRDTAKKTREDAEKSIKKYNEQLEKNQTDAITDLWQRYVELRKELMGVDEYMQKVANNLSWKEIQTYQDRWIKEYQWYDFKKLIELKEKLDEIKLIEENTTEEQRKSQEFIKETSKAQEILNKMKEKELELEEKKASAMEKQAIAQAVMDQENWKQYIKTLTKNWEDIGTYYYDMMEKTRKKIEDEENIEYAKQLENQSTNLNDQLRQFQAEKDSEVEILTDITARKIQLEKEYDKTFQEAVAKQKKSVSELISYWDRLIERKNSYYSSGSSARAYGWDITNAKVSLVWENWPEQIVARTASYIQPRNANNTYNTTTTNDNSFSINWMQINVNNVDDFLDELRQRMTYRK